MIACSSCVRFNTLCLFSPYSFKCIKCIQKDVVYNDFFSETKYDRLSKKQTKLEITRFRHITKLTSLNKRVETLKKTKRIMLTRKTRVLEELKRKKRST